MSGLGAGYQVNGRAGQSKPVPAGFSAKSRSSTVKAQGTGQVAQRHTLLAEHKTPEGVAPQAPRTANAWASVSRTTVAGGATVHHGSDGATAAAPKQMRTPEPAAHAAAPTRSAVSRTTVTGGATTRHSSHSVAAAPAPAVPAAPQSAVPQSHYSAATAAPVRHSSFVAAPEPPKVVVPPAPAPAPMAPVATPAPMNTQAAAPAPSRSPQGFTTSAQSRTVLPGQPRARHTMSTAQAAPQQPQAPREPEAPPAPRTRSTRSVAPTPPPMTQYHTHFTYAAAGAPEPEPTLTERALRAAAGAAAARVPAMLNPEPPPYTEQPAPAQNPGHALPPAAPRRSVWGTVRAWSHRATQAVKTAVRAAVSFVRDTLARISAWFGRLLG